MKFKPVRRMSVSLDLEGTRRDLGTLAWSLEERRAYFEYSADFLTAPLLVSPFHVWAKPELIAAPHEPFDGLHGLFNDSLPDGWGRLLLDRRLVKEGIDYRLLTPLDRLSAVGQTGMGALVYVPELSDDSSKFLQPGNLDWFVEHVDFVQREMDVADIDTLQAAQGGSAGARPKIMIGYNEAKNSVVLDYGQDMEPGYERWIVKGRSKDDHPEIGIEEWAYSLMANAAGVKMAETQAFTTNKGDNLFGTRRFDRTPSGRLHMHTASGILNASHRQASMNYGKLHALTLKMTKDATEVVRVFRHMVFNVYAHNRDDHAKNHAFLMGADGKWKLSPAYDLTMSNGPGGEHSLDVAGNGRNPGVREIMAVAKEASIPERVAKDVVDQVRSAIARWPQFAKEVGLSKSRTNEIDRILNEQKPAQVMRINYDLENIISSEMPKRSRIRKDDDFNPDGGSSGPRL